MDTYVLEKCKYALFTDPPSYTDQPPAKRAASLLKQFSFSDISGSHGGVYEDYNNLGYYAM
jgi:hypothetical protein